MLRRTVLVPLSLALVAALAAACGGDGGGTQAGTPDPSSQDKQDGQAGQDEVAADDVAVELRYEGGFAGPREQSLTVPQTLVTGDGRLISIGPTIALFPGPLLPNLQVHPIGRRGVEDLLARAERDGLLAEVSYAGRDGVMDAPDTVVTVRAGGHTYVHRAYGLGAAGPETDAARARLLDFTKALDELGLSPAGDVAGYAPDRYLIRARVAESGPERGADDAIRPVVVGWPASAPVRLAAAGDCAEVPAASVRELFTSANQLTRFDDGGVVYTVAAVPRLPGQSCGQAAGAG